MAMVSDSGSMTKSYQEIQILFCRAGVPHYSFMGVFGTGIAADISNYLKQEQNSGGKNSAETKHETNATS